MPKVPQRKLSYGEFQAKSNAILRYHRPMRERVAKRQRTKLKDKHLISEQIANRNHIRSIKDEE